jgi:hypothetical protein
MPLGPHGMPRFWQDWANLAVGVWLFVAPWVLGYDHVRSAAWNSWIFGIVVVAVSTSALVLFAVWEEWLNVIFGAWLLVAPWIMGFAGSDNAAALWNHVLVGLAVGGLALWDALAHGAEDRIVV